MSENNYNLPPTITPPKIVKVPVTAYVYKWLRSKFGPLNSYDLDYRGNGELKKALRGLPLNWTIVTEINPLPYYHVNLVLGRNEELISNYEELKPFITAGALFQHEFFSAFLAYKDGQEQLAKQLGLTKSQWNTRKAIQSFCQTHNIGADEYDRESFERHMRRKKHDISHFVSHVTQKWEFQNDGNLLYVPARVYIGKKPYIGFQCFSRSRGTMRRVQGWVPKTLLNQPGAIDWKMWATLMVESINILLRKGCSIA